MTLLDLVLDMRNLTCAWDAVADNAGIAGSDDISIIRWRRNWEERLIDLARAVRCNHYKPHQLRTRKVPKRGQGGYRILRIPTVTDRVLQRACAQVLMPLYESCFLDCSYGYRPKRGLREAVQQIIILRENGCSLVLSADIDAFFDTVDHELLLRFLHTDLPDESLLHLIQSWLSIGAVSARQTIGIPQGSPISPLLANIYLHRFDLSMRSNGLNLIRYADDFVILFSHADDSEKIHRIVEDALLALGLRLEPSKTFMTSFEQGFTFLGVRFYRDEYCYTWEDKEICVSGDEVDWLFTKYGGEYE